MEPNRIENFISLNRCPSEPLLCKTHGEEEWETQVSKRTWRRARGTGGNPFSFGNQKKKKSLSGVKSSPSGSLQPHFRKVCLPQREGEAWWGQVSVGVSTAGILNCSLQTPGLRVPVCQMGVRFLCLCWGWRKVLCIRHFWSLVQGKWLVNLNAHPSPFACILRGGWRDRSKWRSIQTSRTQAPACWAWNHSGQPKYWKMGESF